MVCKPRRLSSWANTCRGKRLLAGMAARSCSSTVARNAAAAAAFFYITRPRDLGLCTKAPTDQLLEGLAIDCDLMGLQQPDTDGLVGSKALRSPQLLFEIRQHHGGKSRRFAGRHINVEQRR